MSLLLKVRKGQAIDSVFADRTYIDVPGEKTVVLHGAAHKTWVYYRRLLWLIKP